MPKHDVTELNMAIDRLLATTEKEAGKLLAPLIKRLPAFDESLHAAREPSLVQ